ncbi:hypothetical protein D3C75_1162750 [compost metagenome]
MSYNRTACSHCFYKRRVSPSYSVAMEIEFTKKTKCLYHWRIVDGTRENNLRACSVDHLSVELIFVRLKISEYHKLMVSWLLTECLHHF